MSNCVFRNLKFLSFLASVAFSFSGLGISAVKIFLSDNPTSEALYISIFTSIVSLWMPSPSQLVKNKKKQSVNLPTTSNSNSNSMESINSV